MQKAKIWSRNSIGAFNSAVSWIKTTILIH